MMRVRILALTALSLAVPLRAADFPVAVAPSDDPELPAPIARDQPLTTDQVYHMTARAMEHLGGMSAFVPDTAKTVILKPNISIARESGTGIVTDARVVRAVALLVHEAAPDAKILIAEGAGGWITPALADCSFVFFRQGEDRAELLQDGFAIAGHAATVEELRGRGIDIELHDLNFDAPRLVQVPGGGLLWDEYELASSILDADVWINIPVAKTHGAKITCCLKNHFGLFPGRVYGWNKSRGTPDHGGIPHWPRLMDESWVDLVLTSQVDLNVVDMLQGTEGGAFEGRPKRSNLIVVGADPIATDLVVAQLMGFNPDDFEYAELGAQRGIGPGTIDAVQVRGGDPMALRSRFAKASPGYGGDWGEHSQYGMGPRRWTLLGPLARDHQFTPAELAALAPTPGEDEWSPVIWFGYDKIDLDTHFDDPVQVAVYAFTNFTMATSDSVRLWIGSDEDLTVWIDGEQVYAHDGRRRHEMGGDKVPHYIEAGEHRLLIRAEQGRGRFDFSINICEPIDDMRYAGNRYPGVRYYQNDAGPPMGDVQVRAQEAWDPYRVGYTEATFEPDADPLATWRTAPDSVIADVTPAATHALLDVLAAQVPAVKVWADDDTSSATAFSRMWLTMGHVGFGQEGWVPEHGVSLRRVMDWAGLDYWLSSANGVDESGKVVAGWLAQGRIPLTGYHDGWRQLAGYRKRDAGVEVLSVTSDTSFWHDYQGRGMWGRLPGRDWLELAVLVVEPAREPLSFQAWVDTALSVSLEFARMERVEFPEEGPVARSCPAGVAAWDAYVIDWERQPWTTAWARDTDMRDRLGRMAGRESYAFSASTRHLMAQTLRRAADGSRGERARLLGEAAEAHEAVSQALAAIQQALPKSRSGPLSEEDSLLQVNIAQLRPLARQARDAERRALTAAIELLGGEPLPPVREDPLLGRDRGRVLFRWKAGFSKGIYDLTLDGDSLTVQHLSGRESQDVVSEVVHAPRRKKGWQVALELPVGRGMYRVLEQPSAANGWRAVIRVDDEWTPYGNDTEMVVWEVPAP